MKFCVKAMTLEVTAVITCDVTTSNKLCIVSNFVIDLKSFT